MATRLRVDRKPPARDLVAWTREERPTRMPFEISELSPSRSLPAPATHPAQRGPSDPASPEGGDVVRPVFERVDVSDLDGHRWRFPMNFGLSLRKGILAALAFLNLVLAMSLVARLAVAQEVPSACSMCYSGLISGTTYHSTHEWPGFEPEEAVLPLHSSAKAWSCFSPLADTHACCAPE
jgi:hypothetical protein